MASMTFSSIIPVRPPTANQSMHWRKKAVIAKTIRESSYLQARSAMVSNNFPAATGFRYLNVTMLRPPRYSVLDKDNLYASLKNFVDGLRDAGIIVDDKPDKVEYNAFQRTVKGMKNLGAIVEVSDSVL